MMKRQLSIPSILLVALIWSGCLQASEDSAPSVSGEIVGGYRVLTVPPASQNLNMSVYRGDYIKFNYDRSMGEPVLTIPDLSIHKRLPASPSDAPYFKMKNTGRFAFSLGTVKGTIEVVAYKQAHYRDVTPKEASGLIQTANPLVLDVRTPGEYKQGHLPDSVLIPVQELQKRSHELSKYKDRDILIYCATGNRSTVASKILIDRGFKRVINLRKGIVQWAREKYPVVR